MNGLIIVFNQHSDRKSTERLEKSFYSTKFTVSMSSIRLWLKQKTKMMVCLLLVSTYHFFKQMFYANLILFLYLI